MAGGGDLLLQVAVRLRQRQDATVVHPGVHLMLVAARLPNIASTQWDPRAYLSIEPLLGETALARVV